MIGYLESWHCACLPADKVYILDFTGFVTDTDIFLNTLYMRSCDIGLNEYLCCKRFLVAKLLLSWNCALIKKIKDLINCKLLLICQLCPVYQNMTGSVAG